jgi:fucose permease
MYLLPVFMAQKGLTNSEIAHEIVFRFLGVLVLAVPLGFLKNKSIYPKLMHVSVILIPLIGMGIVWFVDKKYFEWSTILLFIWGAVFTFMQVPIIPYLLKNVSAHFSTHAISLSYSTWSLGSIVSGLIIYVLSRINSVLFNEYNLMMGLCVLALSGWVILLFYPLRAYKDTLSTVTDPVKKRYGREDYFILAEALFPTLIIAVGAGFTIPLISLFFYRIHHISVTEFSLYSFLAAVLVAVGSLSVPWIKKNFSFRLAVPLTQSLAVVFLILLALTEYLKDYAFALPMAVFSFLLRQPLMNMAGPMTTEVVMEYVGTSRRAIASAITSGIWSGSYVISGWIAANLFGVGFTFMQIFLITSALYVLGIFLYYRLILKFERNV